MTEWSLIRCTNCQWGGTEEITLNDESGCPDCGLIEFLVYASDGTPIPIPDWWEVTE